MKNGDLRSVEKEFPMCSYCGACAAFVPYFDQFRKDDAMTKKGCMGYSNQGVCYAFCPKSYSVCSEDKGECIRKDYGNCNLNLAYSLNGDGHISMGYYEDIISTRAKDEDFLKMGQGGGVVTALLDLAIRTGFIDSAVVADKSEEEPWRPVPKIVTNREEILKASGSKYSACPSILGVWNAIDQGYEKIALVGTPCNIEAMRNIQSMHDVNLQADRVKISIGLFCTEVFWYYDLIQYLGEIGVNIKDVTKFDISKGKFTIYNTNGKKDIPLRELDPFVRSSCKICNDLTSEFADISAGSLGSDEGWITLIVRSKIGKELVDLTIDEGVIETRTISKESISKIKKFSMNKKMNNWDNLLKQVDYCASCNSNPVPSSLLAN